MTNEQAFPLVSWKSPDGMTMMQYQAGLTKREWFAGMAMQGFMVNGGVTYRRSWDDFARDAYYQADAMLAAGEEGE